MSMPGNATIDATAPPGATRPRRRPRPWVAYDAGGYPASEPYVYDPAQFAWVGRIEAQWQTIRDELEGVLGTRDGVLLPYPDIDKTNRKGAWKTAGLMYWTFESDRYKAMFPRTWEILRSVPHLTSASLLLLEPNSTIKPHVGDTNAMVRCHMGLVVPAPAPRCGLRVRDHTFSWEEGRIFMFNDAHEHTAWNNTDRHRYILSFDVMRPEFVGMERWVSSQVLGNIWFDVQLQRRAWLRRLAARGWVQRPLRRLSKAFFRTLIALRLPLYDLL
jgi:aspartyl/asparaginyl beta-hydroxylase (cupin superfamily)